ncbi:hypothetical protein SISNIDRAFT_491944 [Sistotremastrum niveocremeum HHB9708]|uniref:Uncharacterized protein n=1 Tax=Sistotremastrum niveocremeum HHB9708 TaxID=1314777 RepID=A0A164M818_9AGAM|nr:hypothetical protein SISNIDRAFT_491944 [Sistotremastrum niveocremeum HHB9708]
MTLKIQRTTILSSSSVHSLLTVSPSSLSSNLGLYSPRRPPPPFRKALEPTMCCPLFCGPIPFDNGSNLIRIMLLKQIAIDKQELRVVLTSNRIGCLVIDETLSLPITPKITSNPNDATDSTRSMMRPTITGDKIADGDPQRWLPPFTGKTLIQMWKKVEARFRLKISPFLFVALALLPFMFLIFRNPSYPIFTINLPGLHTGPQPTNHHLTLLPGAIAGADQTGSQPSEPPTISLYRASSNIRLARDLATTLAGIRLLFGSDGCYSLLPIFVIDMVRSDTISAFF